MDIPVNLLRTLCVISKHKALFDRACPETVAGKTRVLIPQIPEKTAIDGIYPDFLKPASGIFHFRKTDYWQVCLSAACIRRDNRI